MRISDWSSDVCSSDLVVLDTNILFSALISPHGAPDAIYRAWRAARFEVVTSRMQLDEIRRASRYPKLQAILQPAKVGAMINNLQRAVVLERLTIEVEDDDPDRKRTRLTSSPYCATPYLSVACKNNTDRT